MGSTSLIQEYFLQGSILDQTNDGGRPVDVLLHRLRGLCDQTEGRSGSNAGKGSGGPSWMWHHQTGNGVQSFREHETVYAVKTNLHHGAPTQLRVRRSLDHPSSPAQIRYLGTSETDKTKPTMTRQFVDVLVSQEGLHPFLDFVGFKQEHEYVAKGFLFRKGRMKILVSKIFKVVSPGKIDQLDPLSASHLVELSVVAPGAAAGSSGPDPIGDDVKAFAEMLKPLVHLEKVAVRG